MTNATNHYATPPAVYAAMWKDLGGAALLTAEDINVSGSSAHTAARIRSVDTLRG